MVNQKIFPMFGFLLIFPLHIENFTNICVTQARR